MLSQPDSSGRLLGGKRDFPPVLLSLRSGESAPLIDYLGGIAIRETTEMMARKTPKDDKKRDENELVEGLDPETIAFLKSYLSITDDDLKAHVRRLVEEIRSNPKKKP